jgi:hypothetical protein
MFLKPCPKDLGRISCHPKKSRQSTSCLIDFFESKNLTAKTMMGTEIVVVFLKRRIQPVMSRAHPMWLYSGPMDESRVNVVELPEKEFLDEVRHLTHFSQENSIPLLSPQSPFDSDHLPNEVTSLSYLQ